MPVAYGSGSRYPYGLLDHSFFRTFIGGCALTGVMFVAGCNKGGPPALPPAPDSAGAAATVNGEPISLSDFYEHTNLKQTAQVMTPKGPTQARVLGNFGLQSLQELVDQKVLLQMAKDEGVVPTEADVDAELKFQVELRPDYLELLQAQGLTTAMIRNELFVGLAREHLIMKGITVDPSEVDGYIKSHPEKFRVPAKAALLYIQLGSSAKRAAADAELASGKSFSTVAAKYSEAPHAKDTGGGYPGTIVADMPKTVQEFVNRTAEKGTSAWIESGKTQFKFYVVKKSPAAVQSATPAQREIVRRGIALQKGTVKNDFEHKFYEKLSAAKIDVAVPYLKDPWAKTWNQMSPPGSGSSAPPAAR